MESYDSLNSVPIFLVKELEGQDNTIGKTMTQQRSKTELRVLIQDRKTRRLRPRVGRSRRPQANVGLVALRYQFRCSTEIQPREQAMEALLELAPFAEATLMTLSEALESNEAQLRISAALCLRRYQTTLPEPLMNALLERLWDPELEVRKVAVQTMIHHPDPRAFAPLVGLLNSKDPELFSQVSQALEVLSEALGEPPALAAGDA